MSLMIPQPKYDIGHKFWVPRSKINYEQNSTTIDGVEWYNREETYVPFVKQKEIRCIEIVISYNRRISVRYSVCDVAGTKIHYNEDGEETQFDFGLIKRYDEKDIENYTEEEALAIAQKYANDKIVYYGVSR